MYPLMMNTGITFFKKIRFSNENFFKHFQGPPKVENKNIRERERKKEQKELVRIWCPEKNKKTDLPTETLARRKWQRWRRWRIIRRRRRNDREKSKSSDREASWDLVVHITERRCDLARRTSQQLFHCLTRSFVGFHLKKTDRLNAKEQKVSHGKRRD